MDSRKQEMDQALLLATTETLRPIVQLFLDKLTEIQWDKLGSGYVDKATENTITQMSVDIVNIISQYIYDTFKQSQSEEIDLCLTQSPPKLSRSPSGSEGPRKKIIISEKQIRKCLGDTISLTVAKVMGIQESICCRSTKKVTELVVKEVAERVNSELSTCSGPSGNSSEGSKLQVSKSFNQRLKEIVTHMVKILKKCIAKIACMLSLNNAKEGQQSPQMDADKSFSTWEKSTPQDQELLETGESCQTLVTIVEEEGPERVSSAESFVVTTTEAVKEILKEQGDNICTSEYDDDFSREESNLLATSSSQDEDAAASKIVKVIMEELNLEEDGTTKKELKSEPESSKTSCWKRVMSKIKAFFVHRFAKGSIFKFVAKLRSKLNCFSSKKDKESLKVLIEGVDSLLEDMIPPEEDQKIRKGTDEECIYERIARGISSGELEVIAKQLSNEVFHYLKLGKGRRLHFMVEIQTQVDKFMKLMWNWLNQQTQQRERKKDVVSVAVRQIEGVVGSLPALTEGQDKEVHETQKCCQTFITAVEDDGPERVSSAESFVVTTTEAVKKILKEQGDNICTSEYDDDDFSQEEYSMLTTSSSQDTDAAASEIIRIIMEELNLEEDGTPKEPNKTSCWKRVISKIKAFFVHRFAKESIFNFVAQLRSKLDCFSSNKDKEHLKDLIEGVDSLVEDMIPTEEDQKIGKGTDEVCLYERIAKGISCGKFKIIAYQLTNKVFHYLKRGSESTKLFLLDVQTKVHTFMKLMWNWLNQQTQQHQRKKDLVSVALRQIEGVVGSLPALAKGPLVPESETKTHEPAITDNANEANYKNTAQENDELCCVFLVSGLVNKMLKNLSINVSCDYIKTIILTLKEMLSAEITDCDIDVKPSSDHIKQIVEAVHKDLCKKLGSAGVLQMNLLSEDPLIYKYIIETLKRHLVTPKKRSGINTVFKSVFTTIAKPFSALFRRGRKE